MIGSVTEVQLLKQWQRIGSPGVELPDSYARRGLPELVPRTPAGTCGYWDWKNVAT
jgi:hypothetical protein